MVLGSSHRCVLVFGAALLATSVHAEWQKVGMLVKERSEHASAVVGGKIYLITGIFNGKEGHEDMEVFDPASGTWSMLNGELGNRWRHHVTANASIRGTEVWIVGGKVGKNPRDQVDIYNTATDTWRAGPSLPVKFYGGPSVIVGDTLHAFAGAKSNTVTDDHHFTLDLTDPEATWEIGPSVPEPRVHAAGVAIGETIYFIGGEFEHRHNGDTPELQMYDTSTETWSTGAPMPIGRSHHEWATFVHNGEIWVGGGVDSSQNPRGQSEILIYTPSTDTWREFEYELPFRAVSPGVRMIDGVLYCFGGGIDTWFGGTQRDTYALAPRDDQDWDRDVDRDDAALFIDRLERRVFGTDRDENETFDAFDLSAYLAGIAGD
ncbi:MAG: kelch repeat-containing protein [Planctomycetota bacterium]